MIYLDYNATTPLKPAVRAAMAPFAGEVFGNASSAHAAGRRARAAVEKARRRVAAVLGCRPREVIFTSGGTESNNLALFGSIEIAARAHLVASPIEHSSVVAPVRELERRGARVTWLAVDNAGRVTAEAVAEALSPDTALVSVGWANNEIGTIQSVEEIGAVCRRRGVRLHVDAAQALGKVPVDVGCVDLCALSAHKIGGPVGVGALYVRRGTVLRPLLFGGTQEGAVRPGTENVAGLVGLGAAAAALDDDAGRLGRLRERLWEGLAAVAGIRRHSSVDDCLANTLNVGFDGVGGEALVAALDLEGIAVSVGSACAAGSGEPSHVLRAIGLSESAAAGGVRFSLGPQTTADEIEATIVAVRAVLDRVRRTG